MAPSAVVEERRQKKNKKNKSKAEESNKKNKKRNLEAERVEYHSSNPPMKNQSKVKKRKLESSMEINEDNEMRDDSGPKPKNRKKQQQRTDASDGEENYTGDKIITDERFSGMRQDPLFRRMRKKEKKVVIDSRFDKIFTDKNFAESAAPVDKRGRSKRDEKGKRFLMQHYLNQEGKKEKREEKGEEREDSEEEEVVRDEMRLDLSDSDDVSESDESGTSDDDDDDKYSVNSDIAHYLMANHVDTLTIENETNRLAVVNLDWDHLKAVDLYVVMNSCLPRGGKILSVSVYPSEFGLKCMEIEATHGPSALLDMKHDDDKIHDDGDPNEDEDGDLSDDCDDDKVHVDGDDDEDKDEDASDDDDDDDASDDDDDEDTSEEDEDEINNKLRTYELNKLRYYFAVVVCDSSATAEHLYKTLDATELLKTSNVFDLRFIPDSMEFNLPPRDVATEAPVNYKEPDFETRALQHSKVKLTWENEEPERKKVLRQKFNPDQLDELSMYLASTDESEDEEENEKDPEAKKQATREKFLCLLNSGNNSDSDNGEGGEKEGDMEITFNTDLEALGKKILEKKEKSQETVWESVLRKRKEKKKAQKVPQSMQDDDDLYDDHDYDQDGDGDDFFMEEPTEKKVKEKAKSKDKGKRREKDEATGAATEAELELLLAGDDDKKSEKKGYNMKRLNAKGKKGKNEMDDVEEKFPDVDVRADPRFSALVISHDFALDPTDPQYKRTPAYLRQKLKNPKKAGKRGAKRVDDLENHAETREVDQLSTDRASSQRHELSASIRSVMKNLPKS